MPGLSGRKPIPGELIDPKKSKQSKDEIDKRRLIENSLKTTSKLSCPGHLSDDAKKEWRRIMRLYKQMESSILCDLDQTALSMYCEAVAIYKKAQTTWCKVQQVLGANAKSQDVIDKCLDVMNRQIKVVSSLAEQLCLTPVGRARMGLMKSNIDAPDELSELGF